VLKVSPDEGRLEAGSAYDPAWKDGEDEDPLPADWEYLGRFADAGREGLSAAHNPFGGEAL
jgi:hypothetical protein